MQPKKLSRRKFLKLGVAGSATFLLASCASDAATPEAQSTEPAPTVPPPEDIDLTYWHPFGGAREQIMQDTIIDPFNEANENITVAQVLWTGGDRMEKFVASVAAGTPPDVMMFRSEDLPAFAVQGTFLELDAYVKMTGLKPDEIFYKAEIDARRFRGKTYLLPTVSSAGQYIAYYNVARFEEAGFDPEETIETWEAWEAAEQAFIDKSTDPPNWFCNVDYFSVGPTFLVWLYENGGKYISDDLTEIAFNDDRGVETMQWIHNRMMAQSESYEDINPGTGASDYSLTLRKNFVSGQTPILIDGPWMFTTLAEEFDFPIDKYRIHHIPYSTAHLDAFPGAVAIGGWGNGIPTGGKNHDAAWSFVEFSTTTPVSLDFTLVQGRPNPVKEYNADKGYRDANPYWDTVIEITEADFALSVVTVLPEIRQAMTDAQEEVMYGAKEIDQALDEAAETAQRALDEA